MSTPNMNTSGTNMVSRGGVATLEKFSLQQVPVINGNDIWIEETSTGHKTFKVDGKAAQASNTFVLTDAHGTQIARINGSDFVSGERIRIERTNGGNATVYPSPSATKDRTLITIDGGSELHAIGNVTGLEYEIQQDGHPIATVSHHAAVTQGHYTVEVTEHADAGLVIAIAACLNMLSMPHTK